MATISASQFLRGDPVVDVLGNEAHPEYKKTTLPQPPKTSAFQGMGEAVNKTAGTLFPGVKPLIKSVAKGDMTEYKDFLANAPINDPVQTALGFAAPMQKVTGAAKPVLEGLTLKSLERMGQEVKTPTVSKQYISDLTNRADIKQPERDLIRSKLEEMTSSVGDLYTEGSKKVMDAFSRSGNQKSLGDFGGLKFEMGDFGNNSLLNKAASKDRFSPLEIPDALSNATHVFRASNNPSSYRFDNFVFLSPSEGGMKAVYTRENAKGALEVINAHSIPTEKVAKYLEDIGVSGQNRTGISNLEGSPSNPLTYGNKSSLADKLNSVKGDIKVNIKDFANKVKTELLPLKTTEPRNISEYRGQGGRYESVNLPDELRGPVANYQERVYESPIKTSAGDVHFSAARGGTPENYFAHSRIEDLPLEAGAKDKRGLADIIRDEDRMSLSRPNTKTGSTRRVIEIQSDLFQKGNLEREGGRAAATDFPNASISELDSHSAKGIKGARELELAKLEPYRNTWHERVIREEVKQAAKDGKTKLQFPTGETAMKIEGLGEIDKWTTPGPGGIHKVWETATPQNLKVGQPINQWHQGGARGGLGDEWIITDVLGDGKFNAVQKKYVDLQPKNWKITLDRSIPGETHWSARNDLTGDFKSVPFTPENKAKARAYLEDFIGKEEKGLSALGERYGEQFDISGKVDTNNPIYKFYEKEVGRYLSKKYGAKIITDPQGVKWYELNVPKAAGNLPIEAFGLGAFMKRKDEENQ